VPARDPGAGGRAGTQRARTCHDEERCGGVDWLGVAAWRPWGQEEILSAVPEAITPRIDELFAALESHGHDKTNFHERESVKIDLLVSKETHDKTNCHERESGPAYTLTEQDSSPAYTSR